MAKIKTITVKCAHCGNESEQQIVLSSSSFGNMNLDTRPPMSAMTLRYEIQECPHCHFCNNSIANAENTPKLFSSEYEKLYADSSISKDAKKFLLAAMLQAEMGDNLRAGETYLKAAWVYDDEENNEAAVDARKKAALYLRKHVDATDDGEVALMLVDVLRRVGDFKVATDLIALIGDTGDEFYNNILKFEQSLISKNDISCHNMGEVTE